MLDLRRDAGRPTVLVAIHSFTPRFAGRDRPWQICVCANRDRSFARAFADALTRANPEIIAGWNEPYPVDDLSDYTIPVHGERRGIAHVLVEIRNDEIGTAETQRRWARLIADSLKLAASARKREAGRL
jgi:predicted N-formylglutamate amidohydrolase